MNNNRAETLNGLRRVACKNDHHPTFVAAREDGYCRDCHMYRVETENRGWRFLFTLFSGMTIAYLIFA